jgi:kinesin family protein 11
MCSYLSVNTENENGLLLNLQVGTKLLDLRKTGISSKSFMDEHVSSMGDILSCSKTKWQRICTQAEKDARDTAEFSVAKHGYMEELLQQR